MNWCKTAQEIIDDYGLHVMKMPYKGMPYMVVFSYYNTHIFGWDGKLKTLRENMQVALNW